jgi:hydroxymethylglutaryl-CoA lyase
VTTNSQFPDSVEIVEVGPRDGLQQEQTFLPTSVKVDLVEALIDAGLKRVQVTSFVHPKRVPQMADAEALCAAIPRRPDIIYSGLALNLRGVERAQNAGIAHIDISVSASNVHSQRNANRSIAEAQAEFEEMVALARSYNMFVRGGIQCVFGYERSDDVKMERVVDIARRHLELGVDELALADSAGFANPKTMTALLETIMPLAGDTPVVLHLHDTRGMGLANVLVALRSGVKQFDTSFGGLGGCPFIDGATGNIATEDTAYMLESMGVHTGIDLGRLSQISQGYEQKLGHALPGKMYKLAIGAR